MRESTLSIWTLPRYPRQIDLRPWIPNWIPADFLSVSNLTKPDIGKRYESSSGRTWPTRQPVNNYQGWRRPARQTIWSEWDVLVCLAPRFR